MHKFIEAPVQKQIEYKQTESSHANMAELLSMP